MSRLDFDSDNFDSASELGDDDDYVTGQEDIFGVPNSQADDDEDYVDERNDSYAPRGQVEQGGRALGDGHASNSSDSIEKRNAENIIFYEKVGTYGSILLKYVTIALLICMGHFEWLPKVDGWFWVYMGLFFGIFFAVALVGGILVRNFGVNVMYTRKTIHFFSFFLPFTLFQIVPFQKTVTTYALTCCALFLANMPLRERYRINSGIYKIFYYAFISFDRPKDPFTLLWVVSQSFCTFLVMLPISIILAGVFGAKDFILIPVMTVALGDGLAEPVGVNWGKHVYKTNAMCTTFKYTRSVEGSMCVFLSCFFTILVVATWFSPGVWSWFQIIAACSILPISMTWIEAVAPHAWDNALLLLVGGIGTILIFLMDWNNIPFHKDVLIDYVSSGETDMAI